MLLSRQQTANRLLQLKIIINGRIRVCENKEGGRVFCEMELHRPPGGGSELNIPAQLQINFRLACQRGNLSIGFNICYLM